MTAVGNAAKGQSNIYWIHNFTGIYHDVSCWRGIYIALGSILMGIVGGVFTGGGAYATKLACGIVFSVGLCIVTMGRMQSCFTGNNLVMTIGRPGMNDRGSLGTGREVLGDRMLAWQSGQDPSSSAVIFTMTGIPGSGDIGAFFCRIQQLRRWEDRRRTCFPKRFSVISASVSRSGVAAKLKI